MEGRKVESGQELVEEAHRKLKEFKQVLFEKERSENLRADQEKDSKPSEIQLGNGTGKGSMTVKDAWAGLEETVLGLMKWITAEGAQLGDQLSEATRKELVPDFGGVSSKAEMTLEPLKSEPPRKVVRGLQVKTAEGKPSAWNMNPLDIPEVVANIVGYIGNIDHLKDIRALNKTWFKETFKKWRSSAVLSIDYDTIPVLFKAFHETCNFAKLTESKRAEVVAEMDPFRLREVPFKMYRFASSQRWMYPLDKNLVGGDFERKVIWEKCINLNATYLDMGECILKPCGGNENYYLPGLRWILYHSSNVTEMSLGPLVANVKDNEPEIGYSISSGDRPEDRPIWDRTSCKALQVTTLTIWTSQWSPPAFKSFFECIHDNDYAREIFCMLPNLKVLNLQSDNSICSSIIDGLKEATRTEERFRLETLNALKMNWSEDEFFNNSINSYISVLKEYPSLRELKIPISFRDVVKTRQNEGEERNRWDPENLECLQDTLSKLELNVNCYEFKKKKLTHPRTINFYFGKFNLPNLTHFKVDLNCSTSYGKMLVNFNFNNLKQMPSLREFHFGSSWDVDNSWVTEKRDLVKAKCGKNKISTLENYEMPDLKSFHFHGNFKKEALQKLGCIMGKLETLELVFDQENCLVVKDIWPRLKNLKLLQYSDVPEEMISSLKDSIVSLNVVDASRNWCWYSAKEETSDESDDSEESEMDVADSSDESGESDGEPE